MYYIQCVLTQIGISPLHLLPHRSRTSFTCTTAVIPYTLYAWIAWTRPATDYYCIQTGHIRTAYLDCNPSSKKFTSPNIVQCGFFILFFVFETYWHICAVQYTKGTFFSHVCKPLPRTTPGHLKFLTLTLYLRSPGIPRLFDDDVM